MVWVSRVAARRQAGQRLSVADWGMGFPQWSQDGRLFEVMTAVLFIVLLLHTGLGRAGYAGG